VSIQRSGARALTAQSKSETVAAAPRNAALPLRKLGRVSLVLQHGRSSS
jgi:hypothetical protein